MVLDSVEKLPGLSRPRGFVGAGLVDSYDSVRQDKMTGRMFSPVFRPEAGDHLGFLVGGGRSKQVGVELRVSGHRVETWHGLDSEELGLVVKDLTPYAGKPCRVRIFDEAVGPWGHVVADHFMLWR